MVVFKKFSRKQTARLFLQQKRSKLKINTVKNFQKIENSL